MKLAGDQEGGAVELHQTWPVTGANLITNKRQDDGMMAA